jgi:glycerol-3-phosphate dehydrogenase (NAD(P)+)
MKIAYLGAGTWGFCLARLLAGKGYKIISWARNAALIDHLNHTKEHPHLPPKKIAGDISFTTDLQKALQDADLIIESVTAQGMRSVFEQVKAIGIKKNTPIVLTSKGIEQKTGLIVSDIILSLFGDEFQELVALVSGPGFAEEIIQDLPTSLVCGSNSPELANTIADTFKTNFFRVYPNPDLRGVALGGALKNIIAIACGISDGLNLGSGAKAALMTRGLHEIVKLAKSQSCRPETLYGLSGMGDLFLTCSSSLSRNYRFGKLLSEGVDPDAAKRTIEMVVEGAYSCSAALELSRPLGIPMPIAEAVSNIIEGKLKPQEAVRLLMQRNIKEESL